jgi:cytochrome c-type biogenesis protein CcsB
MDAEGVSEAAVALAESLRGINPDVYPSQRASLELLYNRSNAFTYGAFLYCISLVSLLLAFGTQRKWLVMLGSALLLLALGTHFFGFALRCVIAERYAIQNQFESITGVSLFAVIVAGAIMLIRKQWLFGAAAAATGFLALITATQTGVPGVEIGREAAILNTSALLKYHVTTVLVSYGLITLGFIVSLFYLATYYLGAKEPRPVADGASGGADIPVAAVALRGADDSRNMGRQRTLADLDTAQMTILQLAFWTLGVGILLGAWWADHSWGRWWAFDPKETWALVTWIVYLIVIHLRFTITGHKRALTTAWLSVVGFFIMLWTYFGVNLLLPGLHAYA